MSAAVKVGVEQTRTDLMTRRIQIRFVNDSAEPLTVTRAAFSSQRLTKDAVWSGSSTISPGGVRNLAAEMPEARCTAGPIGTVTVFFVDETGAARSTVTPEDRFGSVSKFMDRDCARLTAERVASVTMSDPVQIAGVGKDARAYLFVDVKPSGRAGTLTLDSLDDTVLLTSPSRKPWELHREINGLGPPETFSLPVIPNRCDPHALAEDKVGTLLTLHTHVVQGTDLSFAIPLSEDQRSDLFDFVSAYCGFATR